MLLAELVSWLLSALALAAIGWSLSFHLGWKAGFKAGHERTKLFNRLKSDEYHGRN